MFRLLAPALLLGVFAWAAAPAAASHVGCGDTITQDTTLDSDLTCPGDGIVINANGVTLDLGGHTITGSGAAFSTGVYVTGDQPLVDVTVRRGTILGFDSGVLVSNSGAILRHLAVTNNVTGILIDISGNVVVRRNVIADNSGSGLEASDSYNVRVTGNDALRNAINGIRFAGEVRNGVVESNFASANGDDGIEVDENDPTGANVVARNLATYNGDLGIEAVAGTIDGGGNRAFGNGNPLQCIGIACR